MSGWPASSAPEAQRLTFVDNATAGANAVLRSLRWRAGERIVIADCAYPGVKNAARFVAERHGLTFVEARVPWPLPGPEAQVEAFAAAFADGARLAIVDHVFAPLAVVSPIEEIVRLCRARGGGHRRRCLARGASGCSTSTASRCRCSR